MVPILEAAMFDELSTQVLSMNALVPNLFSPKSLTTHLLFSEVLSSNLFSAEFWTSEDVSIVIIVFLLPLTAGLLVSQRNPYYGLVLRGIVGAIASLVYALFGAADVALTEALVGTMLSITLYAIAVRSSMVVRIGVVADETEVILKPAQQDSLLQPLRQLLQRHYLRLEWQTYDDRSGAIAALNAQDIHATCFANTGSGTSSTSSDFPESVPTYHLHTHVQRLYTFMHSELSTDWVTLSYGKSYSDHLSGKSPRTEEFAAQSLHPTENET